MGLQERYAELREVGIRTIRNYYGDDCYVPTLKFEKTRRYPYPLVRILIVDMLIQDGYTLDKVASCMEHKRSGYYLGLKKYKEQVKSNLLDRETKTVISIFENCLSHPSYGSGWPMLNDVARKIGEDIRECDEDGILNAHEMNFFIENDDTLMVLELI